MIGMLLHDHASAVPSDHRPSGRDGAWLTSAASSQACAKSSLGQGTGSALMAFSHSQKTFAFMGFVLDGFELTGKENEKRRTFGSAVLET